MGMMELRLRLIAQLRGDYSELGGWMIEIALLLLARKKRVLASLLLRFIQQLQLFFFGCLIILSYFNQFILLGSLCSKRNKTKHKKMNKENLSKATCLKVWPLNRELQYHLSLARNANYWPYPSFRKPEVRPSKPASNSDVRYCLRSTG